jgi:PEP-CTERM motif-containing protein
MNIKRIICLLSLALAASVTPARASSISLALMGPVSPGSTFDIAVQVSDVFAGRAPDDVLLGYGFNVTIGNGSVVQYLSETAGPLFDDLVLGSVTAAGIATDILGIAPGDFVEPLTLATLHFKAIGPGTSSIAVAWDPADLNQGLVYLDLPYGAIQASTDVTTAAVPEPATLIMLTSGFVAVLGARRRKKQLEDRSSQYDETN